MAQSKTISIQVKVQNKYGLHARPVTLIVKLALTFTSRISFERGGTASDAKSVMGLLLLAAEQGAELTLTAEGPDAEEAVEALERLFKDKFGED